MGTITVYDNDGNEYEMEMDDGEQASQADAGQRTPAEWAKLRRAEKAQRDARAAQELADRQLAFYRAGINPDDPRMSYFVKGYDGDLDPTRVKEAAAAAGFLTDAAAAPAGGPVDPTTSEIDRASHQANQAISGAAAGATPDRRTPVAALIEAHSQGGRDALIDQLRAAGVPIQYDSQQ